MLVLSLVSDPCTLAQPQLQYRVVQSWPGSITQPCSLELTPTCLLVSVFSCEQRLASPLTSACHRLALPEQRSHLVTYPLTCFRENHSPLPRLVLGLKARAVPGGTCEVYEKEIHP